MLKQISTIVALSVTLCGLNSLDAKPIQVDFVADLISDDAEQNTAAEKITGTVIYEHKPSLTDEAGLYGSLNYSEIVSFQLQIDEGVHSISNRIVYQWNSLGIRIGVFDDPDDLKSNQIAPSFIFYIGNYGRIHDEENKTHDDSVLFGMFFEEFYFFDDLGNPPSKDNSTPHWTETNGVGTTISIVSRQRVQIENDFIIEEQLTATYEVSSVSIAFFVPEPSTLGLLLFGVLGYSPRRS